MEKCDHSGFQQNLVQFASELIQIDTSNWGDGAETVGEAAAADYCASVLRQYGWDPEVFTTTSDARRGVALRVSGSDPSIPALIFHAHLDTVPAIASEWSRPPFEGAVDEGCVWGRGAVDMKGMVAVILGVLQIWGIQRKRPRRDIIILLLPDEEAGGRHGAEWLTEHRKDLIEGASEAIGEVGGFSVHVTNEIRVYPVQVAEKGVHWVQLRAYGNGGHGSLDHPDNPVARISSAIARLTAFDWPPGSSGVTDELLNRLGRLLKSDRSNGMPESEVLSRLGSFGRIVKAAQRTTVNPTILRAGFKDNVVPAEAEAMLDIRTLPQDEATVFDILEDLIGPDIETLSLHSRNSVHSPLDTHLLAMMQRSLTVQDPGALLIPYMMPASTDAKALAGAGIACYGFTPLRLPVETEYWELFHRYDERVPIDGLFFGAGVLDEFLLNA